MLANGRWDLIRRFRA